MAIEVELFPNSGHHYYFVPLAIPEQAGAKVREAFQSAFGVELPSLNSEQQKKLREKCAGSDGFWQPTEGENMSWLRYSYGQRWYAPDYGRRFPGERVNGLWLAIETNTGAAERGFVWEVNDHPQTDDAGYLEYSAAVERDATPPTPFVAFDPQDFNDEFWLQKEFDLRDHCRLNEEIGFSAPLPFRIKWQSRVAGDPIDVHLIVDFGNSRTAVLGLENAPRMAGASELSRVCRPILFSSPIEDALLQDHHANDVLGQLPQSWFILREPTFQQKNFEPSKLTRDSYEIEQRQKVRFERDWLFRKKKITETSEALTRITRRLPQMFVQLSPAVIGPEALRILASTDEASMTTAFLSSPKRYAWDSDDVGEGEEFWHMMPGPRQEGDRDVAPIPLSGNMLLFFPRHARERVLGSPLDTVPPLDWSNPEERPVREPARPDYPRADSLVWVALSLIETAYQQINSQAWRSGNQPRLRRLLRSIVVTYPPGWTKHERDAYYNAWVLARNIFYWSRFPYWEGNEAAWPVPDIIMNVDEALASQLPIMYSDINHMGNSGRAWIDLYGRQRAFGGGERRTVRALTIDIGGGTTDTAVVEYIDKSNHELGGAHLEPSVLFSDSSSIAGDKLILDIIEKALLPKLAEEFGSDPLQRARFAEALNARQAVQATRLKRSILKRSVFVPMAIRWLEDFKADHHLNQQTQMAWTPLECAGDLQKDAAELLKWFNESFKTNGLLDKDLMPPDEPFSIDYGRVDLVVRDWIDQLADNYARLISAFDCDLVIVSGKSSELPQVREVLNRRLPIEEHRLVFAHKYHAGRWFPGAPGGEIHDAKLVTVVGAALYQAMSIGFVPDWQLERTRIEERQPPARNYWGRHDGNTVSRRFRNEDIYLAPGEDEASVQLKDGQMIGRARFLQSPPEPVYIFRWRRDQFTGSSQLPVVTVRLRRVAQEDGRVLAVEHLVLDGVEGTVIDGGIERPVTLDDVELKLQTLPGNGEHWLDSGVLSVGTEVAP